MTITKSLDLEVVKRKTELLPKPEYVYRVRTEESVSFLSFEEFKDYIASTASPKNFRSIDYSGLSKSEKEEILGVINSAQRRGK